jgi:hypothetical protein
MNRRRTLILISLTAALTLLLAACQSASPAALSDDEVLTLTAGILTAMDEGDYSAFTPSFSPEMLEAFSQAQFDELRAMLQETSGGFVLCGEMSLSNKDGYAIYRILCTYELEDVVITIIFKIDGSQVEGLYFDSPNLRTVSQ